MDREKLNNHRLEENKAKILGLFEESILLMKQEQSLCNLFAGKQSITKLNPNFDYKKASKEEIIKFQLENGIKVKSGSVIMWNPEYKKEALNYQYPWILSSVSSSLLDLMIDIKEKFDEGENSKVLKFIQKKIKLLHKLKSCVDGKSYFGPNYRKINNYNHKDRFDVIWDCNYKYHIITEMKRKGDKSNFTPEPDYPFVDIDMQQWANFERAFRLIPLMKQSLSLLQNNSNNIEKYSPDYSLENVKNKTNRFPEVFKSDEKCELFFFHVKLTTISRTADWSYIYEIFKNDNAFNNNIKPIDYFNLVNKVFHKTLKRLRSDLSSNIYNSKINSFNKNKSTFDKLIDPNKSSV